MTKQAIVVNVRDEPCDVSIMRPGPYGNPFIIGKDGDRKTVVDKYRNKLRNDIPLMMKARRELKGKRLGCCCEPDLCHGQPLAEVVNMPCGEFHKLVARIKRKQGARGRNV